jgi:metal-responsive CopG/Arc/MetJ family transcriptional regulator
MKIAISLPDDLYEAAERVATSLGMSRSELYRSALASFIKDHDDRSVTDALDRVYDSDGSGNRLDPVLEELQETSIPRDEW